MYGFDIHKPVIGSARIEMDKPVAQVFSFVAEHFFENYPKWALEVIEFKPESKAISVGAKASQVRMDQGQKVASSFEISEFRQNERLVIKGLSEPYRGIYDFAEDADRTILTESFELLEIEIFMRPFEKLIRVAIEEGLQNSVENIRNLLQ